jgi:NO-binding membrane sensor protein with MHYT domain
VRQAGWDAWVNRRMSTVVQFAYGPVNPVAGFLLAYIGCLFGLGAAAKARGATDGGRRARWLLITSAAIGIGVWLMHFMAVLGFEVVSAPVRYDVATMLESAGLAVTAVGVGVFIAAYPRRRSALLVIVGGLVTGFGLAGMHYLGMAATRFSGTIDYDHGRVYLSVAVAVLAAIVALWFCVTVRGWWVRGFAAAVAAGAVTAMHYVGMSAVRVHVLDTPLPGTGLSPIVLVLPITIVAASLLMGLVLTALEAMSKEGPAAGRDPVQRPVSGFPLGPEAGLRSLPARADAHPMTINGFATRPAEIPRGPRG